MLTAGSAPSPAVTKAHHGRPAVRGVADAAGAAIQIAADKAATTATTDDNHLDRRNHRFVLT